MSIPLTEGEWAILSALPEQDLVEVAVDLDLLVPARIDPRSLLEECLPLILDRFRAEGVPFSRYDREDLTDLPAAHRAAIARLQGLPADATVDQILRVGAKVYRTYEKQRPNNAIALVLPSLLTALARAAHEHPTP